MKFYKSKVKGVFTARDDDGTPRFVYGTIADLIKAGLLIPDYAFDQNGGQMTEYIKTHWACIDCDGDVVEFDSKEELKGAIYND